MFMAKPSIWEGLAAVHLAHGEHALAVARSNEALQIARRLGEPAMMVQVGRDRRYPAGRNRGNLRRTIKAD